MTGWRRPRILLANEAGGGRGHIQHLLHLARAFGPGAEFLAGLGRMEHADDLAPVGAECFRGVRLSFAPDRVPGGSAGSWGQLLAELGFADEALLTSQIGWWQQLILSRAVDLVVADHAPVVLLAVQGLQARGVPVRALSTGNHFVVPHWQLPAFPTLFPEFPRRLHDEAALLDGVNRAGAAHGVPALAALPAIYRADLTLVWSLPGMDPDEALREGPPIALQSATLPVAGSGDEVFVYFSTSEFQVPAVLAALKALPLPRRGYLPGATEAQRAELAASGMIVEPAALPQAEIVRRSRMMLTSAQHGTVMMALATGLPQVALPQQLEQLSHARAAERMGAARVLGHAERRDPQAIIDACLAVHADGAMAARALAVAQGLRRLLPADPAAALRTRIAPLAQSLGLVR